MHKACDFSGTQILVSVLAISLDVIKTKQVMKMFVEKIPQLSRARILVTASSQTKWVHKRMKGNQVVLRFLQKCRGEKVGC